MEHAKEDTDYDEIRRTLETLHDAQADDEVRDLIWRLISDVDLHRRLKGVVLEGRSPPAYNARTP